MPTDALTTRDAPGYGFMAMTPLPTNRDRWHARLAFVFRTRAAARSVDLALVAARIALAWIFIATERGSSSGRSTVQGWRFEDVAGGRTVEPVTEEDS